MLLGTFCDTIDHFMMFKKTTKKRFFSACFKHECAHQQCDIFLSSLGFGAFLGYEDSKLQGLSPDQKL